LKKYASGKNNPPKTPDLFSELKEPFINGKENKDTQALEQETKPSEKEECFFQEVTELLLFFAELTVKEYEKTQKGDHHGSGIER